MDISYSRVKRLKNIIIAQSLAFMVVVIAAGSLIFYTQGYSFNFNNFRIVKNGLLVLNFTDKPDKVKISGKETKAKDVLAESLQKGNYSIVAEKSGCETWSRNVKIEPEILSEFNNVIFISSNPSFSSMTQDEINWLDSTPDSYLAENSKGKLFSNNYEIWLDKKLITRFSSKVYQVKWYFDEEHITYVKDNEIRIIDLSGYNDTLLAKLKNNNEAKYLFQYQGKVIYYKDGETYSKAKIRCDQ